MNSFFIINSVAFVEEMQWHGFLEKEVRFVALWSSPFSQPVEKEVIGSTHHWVPLHLITLQP